MKRNWRTRRQTKAYLDGQQRWDRAYLYLLEWTAPSQPANTANCAHTPSANPSCPSPMTTVIQHSKEEEESNANSSLCARLDDQSSSNPID